MKKILPIFTSLFFIALVFTSCSKHSDDNPPVIASSMKFSANGTDQSFNTCIVLTSTGGATNEVLITGYNVTNGQASDNGFEVKVVADISSLKAGQTFPAATTAGQAQSSALAYFQNASTSFVTQPANPQGIVTITGVTSTTITGTFSGKLFAQSDTSGTTVIYTITNGTFTAAI